MRRWKRARRHDEAPSGVRIIHADGTVSECALVRDPDDAVGCAWWMAMPPEGVTVDPFRDHLEVDVLPAHAGIAIVMPVRRD